MVRLKVEDRPTPKEVYNWRVYTASAVAAFAAVFIGYDGAFIGTAISFASFKQEFGLDKLAPTAFANISANIVSAYQAGAIGGCMLGYPMGVFLGRRWGLISAAVIFSIGAGIMLAATSSTGLGPIYAGRVLAGAGIGAASNLAPLYISEIAPPAVRGQMLALYEIGWQLGALLLDQQGRAGQHRPGPHAVAPLLRRPARPVGHLPRRPVLPRREPALAHPSRPSRGGPQEAVLPSQPAPRRRVPPGGAEHDRRCHRERRPHHRPRLLGPVQGLRPEGSPSPSPPHHLALYVPERVRHQRYKLLFPHGNMGISGQNTSLLTTGVFGSIKCGLSIVWAFFLVETMGRRKMLMLGAVGASISMAVIAGITGVVNPVAHPTDSVPPSGIASLAFLYVWTVFYAVSWNGTPWVVVAESFSGSIQSVAQVFGAGSNWLWNFVISRATPTMFLRMGHSGYGVFVFFALMMALSIPYVYFLLPETKSVPREEVDRLFRSGLTPRHANRVVLTELSAERDHHSGAFATAGGQGSTSEKDKGEEEYIEGAAKSTV